MHNAIKISGLMDFELLKKVSKMHENVERVFNAAVNETKKRFDSQFTLSEEGSEDFQINKKLKVSVALLRRFWNVFGLF